LLKICARQCAMSLGPATGILRPAWLQMQCRARTSLCM
jgi:hypothetical protein